MTEMKETLVDVNHGSLKELVTIPGIGNSLAEGIIGKRPYQSLHDLVKVSGINEIKLTTLLPYLTLGAKKRKPPQKRKVLTEEPVSSLGTTEAFVFLEDRNDRQDALLILFGGFILGLLIILLRRRSA